MNELTVVKIGSSLLVDETGNFRYEIARTLLQHIKNEQDRGGQVVLVSSGAVALGRAIFKSQNLGTPSREVAASVGQAKLMSEYITIAKEIGIVVGEILLSRPHIVERNFFLRFQENITKFLDAKILPIVNENDTLVTDTDWSFGDNDTLSASLAISFSAKRYIILSHIEGLFTADPSKDPSAHLISEVQNVNQDLMKYCEETKSAVGRGGMISKMKAARLTTNTGIDTYIISGANPEALPKAFAGEKVGTHCLPRLQSRGIKNRDRWVLVARASTGSIEIDDGAVQALRNGKSLLAVGIINISGVFKVGGSVEVINSKKESVAFGLSDISSAELLETKFSEQKGVQVMHADNIITFDE